MEHPGEHVARREGVADLIDALAALAPSDRTSVLMAVMAKAADSVTPAEVLRRHTEDRFVRPAGDDLRQLRRAETRLLDGLGDRVERIALAPTVPFGTHRALGATPQDNVVSTTRGTEVAADATNGLAVEAAVRRRAMLGEDPRSTAVVDLATVQRVTRGQRLVGPMQFAHFGLAARVTASRDRGDSRFEIETIVEHVTGWRRGLKGCGIDVAITVTDFSGRHQRTAERIAAEVGGTLDQGRERGRGYYDPLCFQFDAIVNGERVDVGDGGLVPWTATLLSNAKERLVISGIGVDRVAALSSAGI